MCDVIIGNRRERYLVDKEFAFLNQVKQKLERPLKRLCFYLVVGIHEVIILYQDMDYFIIINCFSSLSFGKFLRYDFNSRDVTKFIFPMSSSVSFEYPLIVSNLSLLSLCILKYSSVTASAKK